ncbi:flagellar biosynthesis regulator FlaF [Phaeobacter sp. PT47_59]|uniref:flagellar biosynthesis regulator FlaF n=1 Tax=Phaeobacter sp. PT47_59 TaxID=3029979 RepID=UPI0023801BE9|nr:flagellar biosynthesis regulator FlaF [Phaeobacter sp. PT47_59]MDE4172960.1 flagellar biosynthesis regulator FlaF [Phaeobacter sp. PT47_59]
MNALLNAKRAYASAKAPTRTPKDLEFEAIARITHRMINASKKGRTGFSALAEAVHENRKLWQIFQTDIISSDNGLPEDLKEQILYLAAFTNQYTSKVLSRKAGVGPLVEINTAIMRGLRSGAS